MTTRKKNLRSAASSILSPTVLSVFEIALEGKYFVRDNTGTCRLYETVDTNLLVAELVDGSRLSDNPSEFVRSPRCKLIQRYCEGGRWTLLHFRSQSW